MAFNIGSVIAKIKADTSNFQKGVTSAKQDMNNFASGVSNSALIATKAIGLIGAAFATVGIVSELKKSIQAANEYESAMIGLQNISMRFGESQEEAKKAAKSLAEDGLISITTAANGLQKLLIAGVGLPEAIELMQGYKDQAAFGRSSTINMDQAVTNLTESFYTENSAIGNLSGQTENWGLIIEKGAKILGKQVSQLSEEEKVLAKLYGQRVLNNLVEGDAARYANTTAGQLAKVNAMSQNLYIALGQALNPAVKILAAVLGNTLSSALKFVQKHMGTLQVVAIIAANALVALGTIVVGVAKAIFYALTFNFSAAANAISSSFKSVGQIATNTYKQITNVGKTEAGKQLDAVKKSNEGQSDASGKKAKKIQDDLEKETKSFEKEMAKREKAYKKSLTEMIRSHLDKKKQLEEDITDENKEYADTVAERDQEYKETLEEMADSHQEKVDDIQDQIDKEVALGAKGDAENLINLKKELEKENIEYEKSVAKETARYEKQKAADEKRHNERLAEYKKSLDEENSILARHQDDVNAIKDQAVEDDITRLKREYEEQKAEAEAEHQEKLLDIRQKATEEGSAASEGIADGFAAGGGGIGDAIDIPKLDLSQQKNELASLSDTINAVGKNIKNTVDNDINPSLQLMQQFFSENSNDITIIWTALWDSIRGIFELASMYIQIRINEFIAIVTTIWNTFGDVLISTTTSIFTIIKGIIEIGLGIMQGILLAFLAIIKGNWSEAWSGIKKGTETAFEGIKNILNGGLNFVKTWGSEILDWLVRPFRDAWNRAQEFINKIKDAMDPNKKHSPSMVDRLRIGVKDLNDAWGELQLPVPIMNHSPSIMQTEGSIANIALNIDMSNAIISDEFTAQRVGESIGDSIIQRLQTNIRF